MKKQIPIKYLVIVFGIFIVICVMLVIPRYSSHIDTKHKKAKMDILFIGNALEAYKAEYGTYPSTEEGLNALVIGN